MGRAGLTITADRAFLHGHGDRVDQAEAAMSPPLAVGEGFSEDLEARADSKDARAVGEGATHGIGHQRGCEHLRAVFAAPDEIDVRSCGNGVPWIDPE